MATKKILLPFNFTIYDQKALDFVISTFASQQDVEVTLFHCYTPPPAIEMRGSPVMEKMRGNLGYLSQKINEYEDELKLVKTRLVKDGFTQNQVHTVFEPKKKDIAGDIVDITSKGGFDVVVLNRKYGKIGRFFTGSIFQKVVTSLKDTTVCIVC